MSDFEINYDFRPYLPDLNIKSDIYNSCDVINNNVNIDINLMVFVININRPLNSIYNDPNYMLFGIKKLQYLNDYVFPSLNFFSSDENTSSLFYSTYNVLNNSDQITNESKEILKLIGYDLLNINENEFEFSTLEIYENTLSIKYKVLYFYFNLKSYDSSIQVNYNNYETSVFYENKNYNVLVYPYYDTSIIPYTQTEIKKYIKNIEKVNTNKFVDTIDFDNREIIKYYEKIDYKYFENTNFTMDDKTNMETLKSYSSNIKNFIQYINQDISSNKQIINVSLNEISKIFYYTTDYNLKNENTYTQIYLNNLHIASNNTFSNQNSTYSYTMDKKMSNINSGDYNSKKYSSYYYSTNIFESTLYQQTINFNVNFYYNIFNNNSQSQIKKLNTFLYKIFIFINPKIINLTYLINNVFTSIFPLVQDSNDFKFGQDTEKLELYLIGNIKQTSIYYISKYKIIFEFIDNDTDIKFTYIVILNVVFYNNNFFYISDETITKNTPLTYINYSSIEENISLIPSIYSIQKNDYLDSNGINNKIFFYNTMNSYKNDANIKNYYWNINYSGKEILNYTDNYISMFNFYEILPNIITNLKTPENKYYNNVINVLKTKINNYIINFINVENNYKIYTHYINNIKKYINFTTLYDENIITQNTNIKYIEYFEYFPQISQEYLDISNNYIGKYSQILVFPYDNINISSFDVLPSGKYIKYNYINYSSIPYPSLITEEFVKSIKTIKEISNYYFSLFIKLPYNMEQDNEFNCLYNNEYLTQSTYSMGIGGNNTSIYLVLTDQNSIPFNFYSNENTIGMIFGIKLYNYFNYSSSNLKLPIIPNLYMTQYLNLNEFVIMVENFSNYSDANNVLWDVNQTLLKIHNFDSLKEIILYDYQRFNSNVDINKIKEQYNKFNYKTLQILYENKVQLNYLRYDIKILIYVSNLYKIIKLIQKIYAYYEIVKINIIFKNDNNNLLIEIIKYNSRQIANLFEINYNLNITSGNFETIIYLNVNKMCNIQINITLEEIVKFQTFCLYIIDYSINKLPSLTDLILSNVVNINNLYHQLYLQIFNQIIVENINYMLGEQIIYDIDNFTNNTSLEVFNNLIPNLNLFEKELLLKQINACLKALAFNTTKINELYNLAKLMADKDINDILPINLDSTVIKNDYIYNTTCYTLKTNIPRFKIVDFLLNTIELVEKLSNPIYNPDNYILYQKAISEGILTYISNTIQYFKDIINKIIEIYDLTIDINDPIQIGNFYNLLELFKYNYRAFFNVLNQNKINKFYEYSILDILFNNLLNSCEEFLLYISLRNDFINTNTQVLSENIFINDDLYKIIKTDVFYDFTIKTIENIDKLVIEKNPQLTIIYLEKIKLLLKNKSNIYINQQTILVINNMIIELKNSTLPNDFINYGSYYILPYQDLLLLMGSFKWSSFNFNQTIIELIKNINVLNISIYESYYSNPEITNFYSQALNYSYLNTPFKYININNTDNNQI
jgi:hypothetical protein